ncbi:GAF and ANTAR domain-containing protein [Mycolicibacterium vaccae]|uniref:GAF and ANTAR domain-containing protein n=1 Tax=Mycolicibacterium vaccae TaxID=1810 RepID=UPI003CFD63E9
MADRERRSFAAELAALVGDVQRRSMSIDSALSELVDSAVRHVPGAEYAAITLVEDASKVSTLAATHVHAKVLDEIQERHGDGPCLSAAWEHHTVLIDDLGGEQRWPRYRDDALRETPIRSVLSFEVFDNQKVLGALNFYAERPHVFGDDALDIGVVFATNIALAWTMLRRDEEFRSALASRDVIGQAKGMLMERFGIDAVHAFELLRRLSQDSNVKLAEVARQLIEAEHPRSNS